jgi:hypothetical protein
LPALQIEAILEKPTIRKRSEALKKMPKALHTAFSVTIRRIQDQKPDIATQAMEVLKGVFLANEPLKVDALRHALAVEPDDNDLDWENFIGEELILDCCLGLIIIDESTSTVRLVHKSLQEHMQTQYDEQALFQKGHCEITHICLTYMAFIKTRGHLFNKYTLLKYATQNWDYHTRVAESTNHSAEKVVITFLPPRFKTHSVFRYLLTWTCLRDNGYSVVAASRFVKKEYWSTWVWSFHRSASSSNPFTGQQFTG